MAGPGGVLRELIAVFGFDVDTEGLKEGESKLNQFIGRLGKLAEGIAAAFAVDAIRDFADEQARLLDQIDDTAAALGISAERVQQFQFASRAMGDDAEKLLNLMGRLQVSQQAAAQGSGEVAKAFSGIPLKDLHGKLKPVDELFLDVAEKIKGLKDPSKAAAIATQLFGRSGRELLPFLKEGRKGFADLVEEYNALGGGYPKKAIERGGEFQKQTARLDLAIKSLKGTILVSLYPVLNVIVNAFTQAVVWFRELSKQSEIVRASLGVLGAAATAFGIKLAIDFAPVLLVAAALAALVLIVDDLMVLFEGGDSAIGEAIDKMFGKDARLDVVQDLRDIWQGIGTAIKTSWDYAVKFFTALTEYGGALGDFLGRVNNAFGAEGKKTQREIVINKLDAEQRAQVTTRESRRRQTDRIEREVFGAQPTTPTNVAQEFAPYTAPDFAPLISTPPPAQANDYVSVGDVKVEVHAAPGMDEKKLAEHTANEFRKLAKQERRAAKATFQTATAQK